jgi:Mn2+/Fe2+ NRAMP family transporter
LAVISHPTKSYLRNNILSGTPGHQGYSEKAVTVFEIVRLSLKQKSGCICTYTKEEFLCVLLKKMEEWKNVVSDEICATTRHCRYVFSATKASKLFYRLLCCSYSIHFLLLSTVMMSNAEMAK